MTDKTAVELKPCPFCGESDVELSQPAGEFPVIKCDNCGAKGPAIRYEVEAARTEWNSRALLSQPAQEGTVMVPREPTKDMIRAGQNEIEQSKFGRSVRCYEAMLSAAPGARGEGK